MASNITSAAAVRFRSGPSIPKRTSAVQWIPHEMRAARQPKGVLRYWLCDEEAHHALLVSQDPSCTTPNRSRIFRIRSRPEGKGAGRSVGRSSGPPRHVEQYVGGRALGLCPPTNSANWPPAIIDGQWSHLSDEILAHMPSRTAASCTRRSVAQASCRPKISGAGVG